LQQKQRHGIPVHAVNDLTTAHSTLTEIIDDAGIANCDGGARLDAATDAAAITSTTQLSPPTRPPLSVPARVPQARELRQ